MCDVETLRLFVNERLSAAADDIFTFFIRTLELYHQQHPDFFSVCEDQISAEHQDRNSSLLQEEPDPPLIKEEQEHEEQLQRPDEADWPAMTSPPTKHDDDDGNHKYVYVRETEAVASTSSQYMESEKDSGTSLFCQSDTEEVLDDCRTTQSTLNPSTAGKTVQHSLAVVEKPFGCTVCDKSYNAKSDLRRHMKTHTGEKPFSCAICGKCFGGKTVLKRHIGTHTGEKPFSCPVCGKSFIRNETMKRHMITHTGERPFSCMICGKCFGLNSHLKAHMRTHTGEKAFVGIPSGQSTNLT